MLSRWPCKKSCKEISSNFFFKRRMLDMFLIKKGRSNRVKFRAGIKYLNSPVSMCRRIKPKENCILNAVCCLLKICSAWLTISWIDTSFWSGILMVDCTSSSALSSKINLLLALNTFWSFWSVIFGGITLFPCPVCPCSIFLWTYSSLRVGKRFWHILHRYKEGPGELGLGLLTSDDYNLKTKPK